MLRSLLHALFAAATLTLVVAGLTVWMRDADVRGLYLLIPGVVCGFLATVLMPKPRDDA